MPHKMHSYGTLKAGAQELGIFWIKGQVRRSGAYSVHHAARTLQCGHTTNVVGHV